MSDPGARVLVPGKSRETWGIAAIKSGAWNLLWHPEKAEQFHRMQGTFPFVTSKEEARERVRQRIATDPEFAKKWEGWTFVYVWLTDVTECRRVA